MPSRYHSFTAIDKRFLQFTLAERRRTRAGLALWSRAMNRRVRRGAASSHPDTATIRLTLVCNCGQDSKLKTPGRKPPPPLPPKPTPSNKGNANLAIRDPVEVYCRLRPLDNRNDAVCVENLSSTTVRLVAPENSTATKNGNIKETQNTFKYVFDENVSQKALFDHVALPLVNDLLHGKNGLLMTYGVTGSGKTFTMTGVPQNGGIMPRCLDVVFNSIGDLQARKHVFKPDRMNRFDVQSQADAMLDWQTELTRTPKTPRRKEVECEMERIPDLTKVETVDEDNNYAVFVSYIEIYNNYVYDLLDDTPIDPIRPKPPQSKILREDATRNMYVHGCVEVEVKSTDEAFDVFYRGQKRKRMAHTTLNTESSRSHSVFTIRLVQVPLDSSGAELIQDKDAMFISQLALVDLAGSERTIRTKNTGDRLREAGNINNSLMVLRTCIEILRENQLQGTNKMVPYRDSKLTHLFKNYFDGEGKVRMIVCINPRADDYDETIHVMRFAELTQEVQVARPQGFRNDYGLTPGRRRAKMFKETFEKLGLDGVNGNDLVIPPIYSLGPPFPSLELQLASDDETLAVLVAFLAERGRLRSSANMEFQQKLNQFRNMLLEVEKENYQLRQEVDGLRGQLNLHEQKLRGTERRLQDSEHSNSILHKKLAEYQQTKRTLEYELDEKDMLISRRQLEKDRMKAKLQDKLVHERGRITREMEKRMKEKEAQLRAKEEKFKVLKEIVNDEWATPIANGRLYPTPSTPNLPTTEAAAESVQRTRSARSRIVASTSDPKLNEASTPVSPPRQLSNMPVANLRHRRSRSGSEVWVDHRPIGSLELDTVMQPQMKNRRSMNRLEADIIMKEADRYCLTHQTQDRRGDIETQLIKGNVIPSVSGGAQVVFNDVEVLKQLSPNSSRKRSADGKLKGSDQSDECTDVETRCAFGIEGHKSPANKKSK